MPHRMVRRELALAEGAGAFASSGLGWPVRARDGKTLYFIMRNDLRVLDPIWATAYVTRNHGYIVFDTHFALDSRDHCPGPLHVERREGPRVTWLP
jgi:peptide/nickel transport system substrate-binding protein